MKKNLFDKTIEFFAPDVAAERYKQRYKIEMLDSVKTEWRGHQRQYDAATKSRHTNDWFAPNKSVNQEVQKALSWLRDRSRDLGRNNPYAKRALRLYPNNAIGTGILPTPRNVRPNQIKALKDAWYNWAEKLVCDYDQNQNFYGLQWLAMRTVAESGECLIRRVRANSSYAVPIRLQVLEGDYLDATRHTGFWMSDNSNQEYIEFYGIRFNRQGERVGYWIWRQHPSEYASESDFVPAKDIIHLYEVERAGQIRGVPILTSVMLRLRDLDDYEFTERIRNKIAACYTVFIEDDSIDPSNTDTEYETEKIEPGAIEQLPPGRKVTVAQPPAKDGFGDYTRANLRGIASGTGASYEGLTGDYSNVNFSSGRMGWLEFAREVEQWQWKVLIPKLCDGVYDWFIEATQLAGIIPYNLSVQVSWTPPRREMIDPKTETDAIVAQLRAGLISWQEVVKQYGYIPTEVLEELKQDKEMWDKLGLMPYADPRFDSNRQKKGDDAGNEADTTK